MSTVNKESFHNYKNEWKYNIELKSNANGDLYVGSLKIRSDDEFGMVAMLYKILNDVIQMGKEGGFKMARGLGTTGTVKENDSDNKK